jgi:transposase
MMRLGHFKAVHVKSRASQLLRTMLAARKTFVDHMLEIEQAIRGFLKVYGLKLGQVHRYNFSAKVKALVADTPELAAALAPLLEARGMMRKKKKEIDRELEKRARQDTVCQRLMTIPGVGPIISLAYKATIDDPARFRSSRAVPAHLGLTPRIYQSGEMDRSGHISKCGDRLLRHCLYEAANAHMRVTRKWSALRAWGVKLAKRDGEQEGLRGRRAQDRHHHASHVARGYRLPIRHGTAAPGKGVGRSAERLLSRGRGARPVRDNPCVRRNGHVQLERTAEPSGPPSWRSLSRPTPDRSTGPVEWTRMRFGWRVRFDPL